MDNKLDINEIRRLLERFYDGMTSREEELRLAGMLAEHDTLPPDLQLDRDLVLAIGYACYDPSPDIELPPEYEARINRAVKTEMEKSGGRYRQYGWKRNLAIVCSTAAAALLLWLTGSRLLTTSGEAEKQIEMYAESETVGADITEGVSQTADTMLVVQTIGLAQAKTGMAAHEKGTRRNAGNIPSASSSNAEKMLTSLEIDNSEPMSETEHLASARRVVEDPDEAAAIISSVFARLDGNLRLEQCLIEDINDQYELINSRFH